MSGSGQTEAINRQYLPSLRRAYWRIPQHGIQQPDTTIRENFLFQGSKG
jgi:hypothetical protein